MAELAALLVGDPPDVWADLGFVVDDGAVHVSGIRHVLGGERKGVRGWSVRGLGDEVDELDGAPFGLPVAPAEPTPDHPNGVIALDHLVVLSPDIGRTITNLETAGLDLRRVRDIGQGRQQAFFKFADVILEVVGPTAPAGDGPLRFYGLAWTVRDLDATAAFLGDRLKPAKDAVQPGRRIATLASTAGSTVPHAFMSPEPD
jgi:hypothetical protein